MQTELKTIKVIDGINIDIIDGEKERLVPIKPICTLFGIDFASQYTKLQDHKLYSSTIVLNTTVAANQKKYEMVCLPYEFTLMWLAGINANRVKPELQERLIDYQLEVIMAIKEHFQVKALLSEAKHYATQKLLTRRREVQHRFNTSKKELQTIDKQIKGVNETTSEEFKANELQLPFKWDE